MELSGRCYCGDIQYEINGEVQASFQCHCRECQYITGGNANTVMVFSCLLYTSPSPRDKRQSRMPSSA